MKQKNDKRKEQRFASFLIRWVAVHISVIPVMGLVWIVVMIPLLPQLEDIYARQSMSRFWAFYFAAAMASIFLIPFLVLGWVQARASFNTIQVLPRRWVLSSCVGVMMGAGLYVLLFVAGLILARERLGAMGDQFIGLFAAFLLIGLGMAQARLWFREGSVQVAVGWLLIHIVVAVLLLVVLDFGLAAGLLLLFAGTTGSLCWSLYERPQTQLDVS